MWFPWFVFVSTWCAVSLLFPGCDRTFITVSALFSHNRAHFREQEQFSCSFPGCNKQYDKACRLKIHMRSHTGIHKGDLYTEYVESGLQFAGKKRKSWRVKERHELFRVRENVWFLVLWGVRNLLSEFAKYNVAMDMQSWGFWNSNSVQKNIPALLPSS